MKRMLILSAVAIVLFEFLNVYFIMPMPGSQRMHSIDLAYFLYTWRWAFRIFFGLIFLVSFSQIIRKQKWLALILILLVGVAAFVFNGVMAADVMFYQPRNFVMASEADNEIDPDRMIIGVELNGEAKAYPISLIGYHHQVRDSIGGKPVMVTYCTVCRTGRVFEPLVNGKPEKFRLVGMDHFNAMFEDETTGSWWRQVSGEAIAGKLKGETLPELMSHQTSLKQWLAMFPNSTIMQPDPDFSEKYDSTAKYERGKSESKLTRTDSLSWKDKSWVIGIESGGSSKAFDWIRLKKERIIQENVGKTPVVLVLTSDDKSFFAFERPGQASRFVFRNDSLVLGTERFDIKGIPAEVKGKVLSPLPAFQEFWHSWRTFHPSTEKY